MKILSICIPTYNRALRLKRSLDRLFPEVTDDVELLISDNCSSDETEEYCRGLAAEGKIIYNRQLQNEGPDKNFLWLLEHASGKYIQLLSDDDYMCPGAVGRLVGLLREQEVALGIINSSALVDGVEMTERIFCDNDLFFNGDLEIDAFFATTGVRLTMVSSLIFNREVMLKVENKEQYLGTNFLQTHIAVLCLKNQKKAAIFGSVRMFEEVDNSCGYNPYRVFIKMWRNVVFSSGRQAGISYRSRRKAFESSLHTQIFAIILNDRFRGNSCGFDTKHKTRYLLSLAGYAFAWKVLFPHAFLPKKLLNFLRRLKGLKAI